MRELADIFGSSADAVFATDRARHLVYANAAFLRLCPQSYPFNGRRCDQVLCGHTLDGKPACRPDCRIAIALLAHRPVASFDLSVPRTHAGPLWVNIGAYSLAARLRPAAAVFVLRPIPHRRMFARFECFERPRPRARDAPR